MANNFLYPDPSDFLSNDQPDQRFPDAKSVGNLLADNAAYNGPLDRAWRSENQDFWAKNAGTPDERATRQALDRFRRSFASAWDSYSQQTLQDAQYGYSDYSQTIDNSRDKILASVSGSTKDMLQPQLDDLHLQAMRVGLGHWQQQSQALQQLIQQTRAQQQPESATPDGTSDTANSDSTAPDGTDTAGQDDGMQPKPMQLAQTNGNTVFDTPGTIPDSESEQVTDPNIAQANQSGSTVSSSKGTKKPARPSVRQTPDLDTFAGGPQNTKPDFNAKTRSRDVVAPEKKANSANPSLDDTANTPARDSQLQNKAPKRLVRDWKGDLVPTETTKQPHTVYTQEDNDRVDKFLDDVFAGLIGNEDWNIGHVRPDGSVWDGAANVSWRKFETVLTPEYGVRMAYINLKNKLAAIADARAKGKTGKAADNARKLTIDDLAPNWASEKAGDNVGLWAFNVSNRSKIPRNQILDINNLEQMSKLLHGIHVSEVPGDGFPLSVYVDGIKMAHGAPPPIKTFDQQLHELYTIAMSDHDTQSLRPLIFDKLMHIMHQARVAAAPQNSPTSPDDDHFGSIRY